MPIIAGLVSITFRRLSPERIIALARQTRLGAIEWGGDVHVPAGDLIAARDVGQRTRDAGLQPLSYGSYYKAGDAALPFACVLDTAAALGACNIRVWAGQKSSRDSDPAQRRRVIDDLAAISSLAQSAGITVSLERHAGTLTDTPASALHLFQELDRPNLRAYWQPAVDLPHADALAELRTLLPWLSSVHVFHWAPGTMNRLPLADGLHDWQRYLSLLAASPVHPQPHAALLEFVQDDSEEAFLRDAQTLRELLATFA